MSIWQLQAALVGWSKQYEGSDDKLSSSEADEMWSWLKTKTEGVPLSHVKH
jgi:hypothetical protein